MKIILKLLGLFIVICTYVTICSSLELKCYEKKMSIFPSLKNRNTCSINETQVIKNDNATVTITGSSNIEVFSIEKSEIWFIPSAIQQTFPDLICLRIADSKLRKITERNFKNLINLDVLDLSGNDIEELEANLFRNNAKLSEIYLKNNKIKKIHSTAFFGLQSDSIIIDLENNICTKESFNSAHKITQLSFFIERIVFFCWKQYEAEEKITELQNSNTSTILANLTSEIQIIIEKLKEINALRNDVNSITNELSKNNINIKPVETSTTTKPKPDSYIGEKLNISISSMIPVPFTSLDVSLVSCGFMIFIFILLLCCICCRKSPKPVEKLKTIVVKSSDYERMKEMSTLRKSEQPEINNEKINHVYDVPKKDKTEDESAGSFDDILESEHCEVQTDWSVAYKTEEDEVK